MTAPVMVVTGGARGLGAAVAERATSEGYAVAVLDVDVLAAAELAGSLGETGAPALAVRCDATQEADVAAAFDAVLDAFGRVDVLVHAVGDSGPSDWLADPIEDFDASFAKNVDSAFLCCQRAANQMVGQGDDGDIVLIGSELALMDDPEAVFACCGRWGERGLMRNVARSVAKRRIRVNAVDPGPDLAFETDAVALVFFLLHEGRSITGQSIPVTGGIVHA